MLQEALRLLARAVLLRKPQGFRFLHVSTDEVFGDLGPEDPLSPRKLPTQPSSPYSSSKAASDHLARAWHRTYGLPVLVTNCSNNYGPYQFPEKLIPHMIIKALAGEPLPVYGDGKNIRDWLFVDDHARALLLVVEKGAIGDTYNIGGLNERTNLQVVETICSQVDRSSPSPQGPRGNLINFVTDRPGHDRRYAINSSKIVRELGWSARKTFETGLEDTVRWYLDNRGWWSAIIGRGYKAVRIGTQG